MTRIAFRMDDITPEMDWSRFHQFQNLFDQYGIKPLLGIVPDNQDPKLKVSDPNPCYWSDMRSLREAGWGVAQHGYQHLYGTRDGGLLGVNPFSEFASVPYELQVDKIRKGKERLREHGLETDIWMAPAHSYDWNTLRALRELGFHIVSDGFSLFPYEYKGLRFIPSQSGSPRKVPFGIDTISIHANTTTNSQFEAFTRFIKKHRAIMCDYSDLLVVPTCNFSRTYIQPVALGLRQVKKWVQRSRVSK